MGQFDAFTTKFKPDGHPLATIPTIPADVVGSVEGWETFFAETGRASSFDQGLIRFLDADRFHAWNCPDGILEDWPVWNGKFVVFGYDWMGRLLAFDLNRRRAVDSSASISILDPGFAEVLDIDGDFLRFLTDECVTYPDDVLLHNLFVRWRKKNGALDDKACVGYRVSLFLGGKDTPQNFERCADVEVYFALCGQTNGKLRFGA